jgi:hypothetical protein
LNFDILAVHVSGLRQKKRSAKNIDKRLQAELPAAAEHRTDLKMTSACSY